MVRTFAKLLIEKGYEVHGAARDAQISSFNNLQVLGIRARIRFANIIV